MAITLRKSFERQFAAAVSARIGFRPYQGDRTYLSRYDVVFTRLPTRAQGAEFIVLLFDHKGLSRISVEIGWSDNEQFPAIPIRPSGAASAERKEFAESLFVARLSTLWGEPDHWWELASEADIQSVLEDVLNKLVEFGMPYFDDRNR